jgi:hypothetical protein
MLMGHPPPLVARGRDNAPQGCFAGLTPVPVPMVVEELVACDAQVQEAVADIPEVGQDMTQARPKTSHRVTVHTRAVGGTTRIRARAMVDRPMIIVGRGAMGDSVCIGEELRSPFPLGGSDECDRRGPHVLEHCEITLRGWRVLGGLVAVWHPAQEGWTACLGGGTTAQLPAFRATRGSFHREATAPKANSCKEIYYIPPLRKG